MKDILSDILTIPGVIGGFFYHKDRGLLAVNLPAVFKPDRLEKMARMMLKIFSSGRMNLSGVAEVSICYDESILVAREVDETSHLILLCETRINAELLGMSLNLSMEDARARVNDYIQGLDRPPEPAAAPGPAAPDSPAPKPRTIQETIGNNSLAETLSGMEASLAKVIGPIYQIVFQDALSQWMQTTTPAHRSLPALVKILLSEIEDPDRKRKYQQLVAPHLQEHP